MLKACSTARRNNLDYTKDKGLVQVQCGHGTVLAGTCGTTCRHRTFAVRRAPWVQGEDGVNIYMFVVAVAYPGSSGDVPAELHSTSS